MTYAYACLDWPSKPLLWKRGYETQRASEPAKSDPCSLPSQKGSGVLPLDKTMKMDHDNLRKKSAMASFLTNQT